MGIALECNGIEVGYGDEERAAPGMSVTTISTHSLADNGRSGSSCSDASRDTPASGSICTLP
jgi:hypothetical protein